MVFNTCINCTNYNVQAVIHFFISLIKMKIKLIDEASFVKMQNITCASIFHYLFQVVWPATYLINGWIDCTPFKLTSIFFVAATGPETTPDDHHSRARRSDSTPGTPTSDGGWAGAPGKHAPNGSTGPLLCSSGG